MADHRVDGKRETTLSLLSGETATITASGEIAVDGPCIQGNGRSVEVQGIVHTTGTFGTAISLQVATVTVGVGAKVFGRDVAVNFGIQGSIDNQGTISSDGRGIVGNAYTSVSNKGLIEGDSMGVQVLDTASTAGRTTIHNSGTIRGGDAAIQGGSGDDFIRNTGRVEGAVVLGNGDDQYQGGGGQATGVIDLGDGDDLGYGGDGNEIFYGGAGDDYLYGGAGIDTAIYTGGADLTVDLAVSTAQETGQGKDRLIDIENIWSGNGSDRLSGDRFDNTITGNGGDDIITGGGGRDTVTFAGKRTDYAVTTNADGTVTVADSHGGRDGRDVLSDIRLLKFSDTTIALTNTAPFDIKMSNQIMAENAAVGTILSGLSARDGERDAITYSLDSTTGPFAIEGAKIVITGPLDFETHARHTIIVKATDAYGAETTKEFTVTVTDVAEQHGGSSTGDPTDGGLTLYGTPRADALTGAGGNDAIWGLSGNDRLRGEAGNDRLCGGKGRDTMWGGSGLDIFVFESKPNKNTNLDKIADFNVADDTIYLAKSAFSKIGKKGMLKKSAFHAGTDAHDANDRVIYNKKTGALFYDPDGNGDAAQVQIATLSKSLKAISNGDFFIT